ncbi:RumC family sactipeptide [Lacrimispora xylanisolvens]|uniref:RumC family sactipeptide n=1 Tax=Lacrimispora xylanisolvens TaxID=384636 RepID=UPI00240289B4
MKLVNPLGREIEKLNSQADYVSPLSGCVCSGPTGTAVSHNKGPGWCVGYCGGESSETRNANAELARYA